MEHSLQQLLSTQSLPVLLLIIGIFIFTLGKGADLLVDEAVTISIRWGLPRVLVGATVVSLGTTLPEAAVSVLAAVKGRPGLALGNAVGSIICDTGLILGLAAVISPLPLRKNIVNRQGWVQVGAGFLLVAACLPYGSMEKTFSEGGNLPRAVGFLFLALLVGYMWMSVRWVKGAQDAGSSGAGGGGREAAATAPDHRPEVRRRPFPGHRLFPHPDSSGGGDGRPDRGPGQHHRRHTGGLRHLPARAGHGHDRGGKGPRGAGGGERDRRRHPQRAVRGRRRGGRHAPGGWTHRPIFSAPSFRPCSSSC